MVDLTLLELHLHDGVEFSPRGVIGGRDAEDESADGLLGTDAVGRDDAVEDDDGGGRGLALLGLIVLGIAAAVAAVAARRRDGEETDVELEVEEVN